MSGFRSVGRSGLQSADFRILPQSDDESTAVSSPSSGIVTHSDVVTHSDIATNNGIAMNNDDAVPDGTGRTPGQKLRVAVLGATGVVGQRFVRRLADHPNFDLVALAASERSVGKAYEDACTWHLDGEAYAGRGGMIVRECKPEAVNADLVFSALDTEPAREIEPAFAAAGAFVFSNASAFRMDDDVPLLIPEINASHLGILERQKANRGWKGAIVTNPNCTTVVLASALAPLDRAFGIEAVMMTSMQAISGAGYPGVSAMDISGNVIPHIRNEEPKVEVEADKILGRLRGEGVSARQAAASFPVSATCTRVPVLEGHTIAVSVRLKGNPSVKQVEEAFRSFVPDTAGLSLHSAPERFIVVSGSPDRPQPKRDVEVDGGMRITVGRIRPCPVLGIKFIALGHNTERGAAGASVLNAELAYAKEVLQWVSR
ncbi:MAG TPA: aspartate-semialdehyde dehydrogenase [Rectinemataceae bacterium]|nr:aspartate-semialdehyde dehydrogenase [Rectinemataceae bacterium]